MQKLVITQLLTCSCNCVIIFLKVNTAYVPQKVSNEGDIQSFGTHFMTQYAHGPLHSNNRAVWSIEEGGM